MRYVFLLIFIFIGCQSDKSMKVTEGIILLTEPSNKTFLDVFELDKVIALESSDKALLGGVNLASFTESGTVIVLDETSSKSVKQFDQSGRFIQQIGHRGQGPGEFEAPDAFVVGNNEDIYILSDNRILKYKSNGEYTKEFAIECNLNDLKFVNENIYTYVQRCWGGETAMILELNEDLNLKNTYGEKYKKFQEFNVSTYNNLVRTKDGFIVLNSLESYVDYYNLDNKTIHRDYAFKNTPAASGLIDKIPNISLKEEETLFNELNVFVGGYGNVDQSLFVQVHSKENIFRLWLYDDRKTELNALENLGKHQFRIFGFSHLVGEYKNGVIGVILEQEDFETFKSLFPDKVQGIYFDELSNPIIVFFKFKGGK